MTKLEIAARQALEALEVSTDWDVGARGKQLQSMKAIAALREALAEQAEQEPCIECGRPTMSAESKCNDCHSMDYSAPVEPVKQEPVAERFEKMHANGDVWITTIAAAAIARNAAPVRTKDLTDDEIMDLVRDECVDMRLPSTPLFIARAVIAADREKNK